MHLVSILIPAFNAGDWIATAIESALTQTWKNVEVIVVDDGSTDETLTIAQRYAGKNVQILTQPNQGAAAARNRALAEAQGGVIQYLDADDVLAPDKIEQQVPMLEDDVLCSGAWGSFYTRPQNAQFEPTILWRDLDPIDWLVSAWRDGLMMPPVAWIVGRELVTRVGPWDERLSLDDDGEFFTRMLLSCRGVKFCPGARAYYRAGNPNSLSWKRTPAANQSHYLATTLSIERLLSAEDSLRTRQAAAAKLTQFVYKTYPESKDLVQAAEQRIATLGLPKAPRPRGGRVFRTMSRLIGWKAAKSIRQPYYFLKIRLARMWGRS